MTYSQIRRIEKGIKITKSIISGVWYLSKVGIGLAMAWLLTCGYLTVAQALLNQ
jgi:hypothetical protein